MVLACIMFHDDGVTNSISESEKIYVLGVWNRANEQMDDVVEQCKFLLEHPENERQACHELADAVNKWHDTMDIARNEAVFFFGLPETNEASLNLASKIENELYSVTSDLIEEITRRRDQGLSDQAAYDVTIAALSRKEKVSPTAPCIPDECIMCRTRKSLTRFLIKHSNVRN